MPEGEIVEASDRHVWFVNHYASRPGEPGIRHYSLAREIQAHGWSGTVLGCSAQHYTGQQRLTGARLTSTERIDGVTFRWLRLPTYRTNGVMRILNMIGFAAFLLLPWATRGLRPPDVIVGSTVHPLAAWAASRLARKRGVPFVFEIRDLWPETLIELGAIGRDSVPAVALRRLETSLCTRASRVITTMPFAYEYLIQQGISPAKVSWISNGVNSREFELNSEETPVVDGRPFTFMYFGALGRANCVGDLVDAFLATRFQREVCFRIIGTGPLRAALQERVDSVAAGDRVTFEAAVPRTRIPALAAQADCLVVGIQDTPLYDYGISLNKLFEYMAAAKPVLFSGTARGNPLLASGGGICCPAGVEAIGRAMSEFTLVEDAKMDEWGQANQHHVKANFDFQTLGRLLAELLDEVTDVVT